jgi:fructosamine-3-kinase
MTHPLITLAQQLDPSAALTYSPPRITSSNGAVYYAKLGSPSEQPKDTAEIASLNAIHDAAPGLAPRVLLSGTLEDTDQPYMITEYKDLSSLSGAASKRLAVRLATEMHRYKSPNGMFGFEVPTFCGPTRQANGWSEAWKECYDKLIGGLLEGLREKGYEEVCEKGEQVRRM